MIHLHLRMKATRLAWSLLLFAPLHSAFAQEQVNFSASGGLSLKVWHFKPQNLANSDAQKRPTVIALHGCGGLYATAGQRKGLFTARHQGMGEMLSKEGYNVVFPDSFGSRGVQGICSEVERLKNGIKIDMPERRSDVLDTLAWIRSQAWADANRIAILGWSHGAMTLLAATDAHSAQVRAANPPVQAAIAFYPGCVLANRQAYRPNTALTLLLGADDDWTLPEPCIQLAERLIKLGDPVKLKVYEAAVHGFDNPLPGRNEIKSVPSRHPNAKPGEGVKAGQHPQAFADSWALVRQTLRSAFE